jgi:hypothetical protein
VWRSLLERARDPTKSLRPPASSFSVPDEHSRFLRPRPRRRPSVGGGFGRGRADAEIEKGQERLESVETRRRRRHLPTVDEIPAVAPVDVESLPEDVRLYRQERAKNWPGRAREEARNEKAREGSATDADAAAAEAEEAERPRAATRASGGGARRAASARAFRGQRGDA